MINQKQKRNNLPLCFCGIELSSKKSTFCSKHRSTRIKGTSIYKDNLPKCSVCDKKLSSYLSKNCNNHRLISEDTRKKLSVSAIVRNVQPPIKYGKENHFFGKNNSGDKNPNWIKDRSKLQKYSEAEKNRRSYSYAFWRNQVRKRDNFCCKINNKDCNGKLEVHHILSYTEYPELRFDINNGISLCHFHHPFKKVEELKMIPLFQSLIYKEICQ